MKPRHANHVRGSACNPGPHACNGADIKLAGSLSVAISLPAMVVGFIRSGRDSAFEVPRHNRRFALSMALGSTAGAAIGGQLPGVVPNGVLLPVLAAILVISAGKVWRHN